MTLPLIALRRLRTGTGLTVRPGCPIPGSDQWSKEERKARISEGVAKEGEKPKAKKTKASKAKPAASREE